jgi:hypothetical protein
MVILSLVVYVVTMVIHRRLTHSPQNCWARTEHEKKASGRSY